jgi:predicted transcriptional regulator
LTLLDRLEAKGHVTVDRSRHAHIFRPTSSREQHLIDNHLKSGVDQFRTLGPNHPPALARALTGVLSPDEIAALRDHINSMFEDDDGD